MNLWSPVLAELQNNSCKFIFFLVFFFYSFKNSEFFVYRPFFIYLTFNVITTSYFKKNMTTGWNKLIFLNVCGRFWICFQINLWVMLWMCCAYLFEYLTEIWYTNMSCRLMPTYISETHVIQNLKPLQY